MRTIIQTYAIKAPIHKVWEALTKPDIMQQWSGGSVEFDAKDGGKFSLWNGDIHGVNTKVIPPQLLEEDWYSTDDIDPSHGYKVSFALSEKDGVTTIKLTHPDIPNTKTHDYAEGWRSYYFDPIKQLLET